MTDLATLVDSLHEFVKMKRGNCRSLTGLIRKWQVRVGPIDFITTRSKLIQAYVAKFGDPFTRGQDR